MVKLEPIKSVIDSYSSSSSSDDDTDSDDRQSTTSSSDSCLSLIETSRINSLKSCQKRQLPTSVHVIPQGTIVHDINNNQWLIHQCLQIFGHNDERFIYLCNQIKRSLPINDTNIFEENLIKIKISPCANLPDKFKQSRQTVIKTRMSENEKLESIFYGNLLGEQNKEIQFFYPNHHSDK